MTLCRVRATRTMGDSEGRVLCAGGSSEWIAPRSAARDDTAAASPPEEDVVCCGGCGSCCCCAGGGGGEDLWSSSSGGAPPLLPVASRCCCCCCCRIRDVPKSMTCVCERSASGGDEGTSAACAFDASAATWEGPGSVILDLVVVVVCSSKPRALLNPLFEEDVSSGVGKRSEARLARRWVALPLPLSTTGGGFSSSRCSSSWSSWSSSPSAAEARAGGLGVAASRIASGTSEKESSSSYAAEAEAAAEVRRMGTRRGVAAWRMLSGMVEKESSTCGALPVLVLNGSKTWRLSGRRGGREDWDGVTLGRRGLRDNSLGHACRLTSTKLSSWWKASSDACRSPASTPVSPSPSASTSSPASTAAASVCVLRRRDSRV